MERGSIHMKMKVAEYMAEFFVSHGIRHCFMVTGGGAMHLDDAFTHKNGLKCVFNHHEQACAIAAEAYMRYSLELPLVCVTSGPGGTNALTGVLGAWLDSIPMFVVSGQVKRITTIHATDAKVRQVGDQEFNITDCVAPMTKYAVFVDDENSIAYHLEKAYDLCRKGRGGPVWLDVPLDVQAAVIDTDHLMHFEPENEGEQAAGGWSGSHEDRKGDQCEHQKESQKERPCGHQKENQRESQCGHQKESQKESQYEDKIVRQIIEKIEGSIRPIILAGTGIRLGGARELFLEVIDRLQIPVVTAWNAHDVIWDAHPLYAGRPGTVGTRGGNFAVQNSDLLISLGCRLNIRQISYNYDDFAKDAYKIIVDIDEEELKKHTIHPDMAVHADVKDVLQSLLDSGYVNHNKDHEKWLAWCRKTDRRYPAVLPAYYERKSPVNPYVFMKELFDLLDDDETVVTGNGSACVVSFQTALIKKGTRLFTNSGCATMGYGVPAALGVSFARTGKRVICLDGDGSIQMNLQELQTIVYHQANIKIFVLNNDGYHSMRQTQSNLFQGALAGVSKENGISFPDMRKIAYAYGIPYTFIDDTRSIAEKVHQTISTAGPVICEVMVDKEQFFEPKLSSRVMPDGTIVSPAIDDLSPFLPREEYLENKNLAACKV